MSELDSIAVIEEVPGALKASIEAVCPQFARESLLEAQEKTWKAYEKVKAALAEGMTEDDARRTALEVFAELGVTKHWHKPYIRFGQGTALTFNEPLQPEYRLRTGDPVYIDLGPVWSDSETGLAYEGDVGDSYVFGANQEAEACAQAARQVFSEARERWRKQGLSGEALYAFARSRAQELGYRLVEKVEGHRLGDFPHHKYSREHLASVRFQPADALWVLEIQLNDPQNRFGAFFEDILN